MLKKKFKHIFCSLFASTCLVVVSDYAGEEKNPRFNQSMGELVYDLARKKPCSVLGASCVAAVVGCTILSCEVCHACSECIHRCCPPEKVKMKR